MSSGRDSSAFAEAVLYITGETDIENVPESEMEMFRDLQESPLPVNLSGRSKLASSGLLSPYQIASLLDYISVTGDIMSMSELAAVDGFGEEMVKALAPFISLESTALPGQVSSARSPAYNYFTACSSSRQTSSGDGGGPVTSWSLAGKYRIDGGGRYDAGFSAKRYYDSSSANSAYMTFYGRKHLSMIAAGDMSLRFGQGLALWTGFSMSGLSGVRSFWKRPSGISPSRAYSGGGSVRGLAAEFTSGDFSISAFMAFPGLREWCDDGGSMNLGMMPGLNLSWYMKHGQLSMTAFGIADRGKSDNPEAYLIGNGWNLYRSKVSADARFTVKGAELFGEAAFDAVSLKPSVTGGFMCPIGDKCKTSVLVRWIPEGYDLEYSSPVRTWSGKKGETGISAGLSLRSMEVSADFAVRQDDRCQARIVMAYPVKISGNAVLTLRLQERLRTYDVHNRTDFRADLKCTCGQMQTVVRGNVIVSRSASWLSYVEEGYAGQSFAVFLRGTAFMADNWDDRIYCYERDAPGSFNVPAYYGRGYSVSAVARLKLRWSHVRSRPEDGKPDRWRSHVMKAYFRAGWMDTPWNRHGQADNRRSKAEGRLQIVYEF